LSLYSLFFLGGIIADLLLGISVTKLWYYNYHYYFEYIPLYFLIYPLGGIVMVQTFVFFSANYKNIIFYNPCFFFIDYIF